MQFFPTAEGYVSRTGNAYNYIYNYTDHLGNVRVSYTKDPVDGITKIVEENNYYPFGLKHANYNSYVPVNTYNYKYNGKELQEELGLNMYDYGARNYDPAIGRWMNIDPKAEISRRWSPYTYCYNNPLIFTDPDGMAAFYFDKKAEKQAQATEKKLDKKIAEVTKGDAADKNDRIAQLNKSKSDISDMRNDKNNEYKFENASQNNGNPETKRTGANEVTIFTDDFSKEIHENRHGGQIARGEFDIDTSGSVTSGTFGVSKEIDAYNAQYSYDGKIDYVPNTNFNSQTNLLQMMTQGIKSFTKTITNMGQITNAFIQSLVDNPGLNQTPIYPDPATNPTYYQQ